MNSFFLQESQTDFAGASRQFSAQGEDIWLENQNDFRLFLCCDGDIICDCLPFPHWFCHPYWLKTLWKTSSVGSFVYNVCVVFLSGDVRKSILSIKLPSRGVFLDSRLQKISHLNRAIQITICTTHGENFQDYS